MRPLYALLLFPLVAAAPAQDGGRRKAEAYLEEVRSHLREHHVDGPSLRDEDLHRAGIRAMAAALGRKEFAALDEDRREACRKALADAGASVKKALDAAEKELGPGADFMALADAAANAMVRETGDPFSRLMRKEDLERMTKMLEGEGRGDSLGISIVPKDGGFRIMNVHYGSAPYDEGVEIGDDLIEIGGKPVAGWAPEDVSEALKAAPGTRVTLKLRREGFADPIVVEMTQKKTFPGEVLTAMLGERVGYLRMTLFSSRLRAKVLEGLRSLRAKGMESLILDLRANPGGSMNAATEVADLFLAQNLTITRVELHYQPGMMGMPHGLDDGQVYMTRDRSDFEEIPIVLLINHASASASELLSGALQDHHRATILGETTFGKGVGQQPIPLLTTVRRPGEGPERFLYLTILRYYLPSGRSIHHKGVSPETRVPARHNDPKTQLEVLKLRASGRLDRYLDGHWGKDGRALARLAEADGFDASRYPGFDALEKDAGPALTRDQLREELRRAVRRRLTADDGTEWVVDLETDTQLQYALVETLDRKK